MPGRAGPCLCVLQKVKDQLAVDLSRLLRLEILPRPGRNQRVAPRTSKICEQVLVVYIFDNGTGSMFENYNLYSFICLSMVIYGYRLLFIAIHGNLFAWP